MIDFRDFDSGDTPHYMEYLRKCSQIDSIFSPLLHLALKDKFQGKRGYAANLCWHKFEYVHQEIWLVPVGDWQNVDWLAIFRKYVPANTIFFWIPSIVVEQWQEQLGNSIVIEGECPRGDWEYILSTEKLANFADKKLQSFRRHCRSFEKNYDYSVEAITPQIFPELIDFHKSAERKIFQNAKDTYSLELDDLIFYKTLDYWEKVENISGFVVRVRVEGEEKIAAYVIDEIVTPEYGIGHFAKADYSYTGINQFAYWYDAKFNLERGVLLLNIMNDCDEEGLRIFKENLAPVLIQKLYTAVYVPQNGGHF